MFHAELKGAGIVPGVIWDTFPCTLLEEDWLYGDAKWTVVGTTGITGCGTETDAVAGIEAVVNGVNTRDAA